VTLNDASKSSFDLGPRFFPGHLNVDPVAFGHRDTQTIRILVQMLKRRTLRADEALRKYIIFVASDALNRLATHPVGLQRDLQSARCLTQRARSVCSPYADLAHGAGCSFN
jgi:hypothetical protein